MSSKIFNFVCFENLPNIPCKQLAPAMTSAAKSKVRKLRFHVQKTFDNCRVFDRLKGKLQEVQVSWQFEEVC